jgi:hypothetical protein
MNSITHYYYSPSEKSEGITSTRREKERRKLKLRRKYLKVHSFSGKYYNKVFVILQALQGIQKK